MEDAVELQGTAFLGLRVEVFWRGTEEGDTVRALKSPFPDAGRHGAWRRQWVGTSPGRGSTLCRRLTPRPRAGQWYAGVIQEYDPTEGKHLVLYDDGDEAWYKLSEVEYRILGEADAAVAERAAHLAAAGSGMHPSPARYGMLAKWSSSQRPRCAAP